MPGATRTENTQDLWGIKRLDDRWKAKWPKLHICRVHKTGLGAENALATRMNLGFKPIEAFDITIDEKDQLMLCGGVQFQLLAIPNEEWEEVRPRPVQSKEVDIEPETFGGMDD